MRAVVQRTTSACVTVEGRVVGQIERGLLVLLGIGPHDREATAQRLATRIATLRVFADGDGRMNLDVAQAGGSLLVVSQFTLHADSSHGHRPSFIGAGSRGQAAELCTVFVDSLRGRGLEVATGQFGAHMEVSLTGDGPVTLVLTSGEGPWAADAG